MIGLTKRLKSSGKAQEALARRVSIRDRLLLKEVHEMEQSLPPTCKLHFSDPGKLYDFNLTVSPDEGCWQGGKFKFHIFVTDEYNMAPPQVKCLTRLWHPNISEDGNICLSILRQNSVDGLGWAPTRRLRDVIWGLNSLFTDLLNFEDPLNIAAAEQYSRDKSAFYLRVKEYVNTYAKR